MVPPVTELAMKRTWPHGKANVHLPERHHHSASRNRRSLVEAVKELLVRKLGELQVFS